MSKAGKLLQKVEDEIESIFLGEHGEKKVCEEGAKHKTASDQVHDGKDDYHIETENLAVPEIHTGKAQTGMKGIKEGPDAAQGASGSESGDSGSEKKAAGNAKKVSVQYDTLAVPEIHIPHGK